MTTTAVRLTRTAVAAVLALLVVASPVQAAGTGGIEISPYPGVVDGKQVTAFHAEVPRRGSASVRYSLRNTTKTTRAAHLYAAEAVREPSGSWTIGNPASSPYVAFPERTVTLKGGASSVSTFRVHGKLPSDKAYAALVVEVKNGAITQRAATIVYLTRGPAVPLPLLIVLIAVLLLVTAAGAVFVVRRRNAAAARTP